MKAGAFTEISNNNLEYLGKMDTFLKKKNRLSTDELTLISVQVL